MSPDLTIIIPSYNNAGYLGSSIGSLSVDNASLEIIVVDDGSTDDTQQVLTGLSKSHENLRVITQANSGVSSARNAGIREAAGRFVMFVDADDRLLPKALDSLSLNMKDCDADIVVFRQFCVKREVYKWKGSFKEKQRYSALDLMRRGYIRGSACGCVFRLDYLKCSGVTFCEDLSMAEDTVFFACAISSGACISFMDIPLYETIPREGSASRSSDSTFLFRYGRTLKAARSLISDRCVADNTILTLLMGIVHVAAKTGYSPEDIYKLCKIDTVLPLYVPSITRYKWLVKVLNHSFSGFYAIKKWRDRFLP